MRPSKLFHTIVIVGAALGSPALGACGATTVPDAGRSDAGASSQDAGEMIADAAMDAAMAVEDAGEVGDAGTDAGEDAMVLIL